MLQIWTYYDLVPLLSERLHSNPHKTIDLEFYREEFKEKHHYDYALYQHALDNPRDLIESIEPEDFDLNFSSKPAIMMAIDHQKDKAASIKVTFCHINEFKTALKSCSGSYQDLVRAIQQANGS